MWNNKKQWWLIQVLFVSKVNKSMQLLHVMKSKIKLIKNDMFSFAWCEVHIYFLHVSNSLKNLIRAEYTNIMEMFRL